jgi:hypothetical protein
MNAITVNSRPHRGIANARPVRPLPDPVIEGLPCQVAGIGRGGQMPDDEEESIASLQIPGPEVALTPSDQTLHGPMPGRPSAASVLRLVSARSITVLVFIEVSVIGFVQGNGFGWLALAIAAARAAVIAWEVRRMYRAASPTPDWVAARRSAGMPRGAGLILVLTRSASIAVCVVIAAIFFARGDWYGWIPLPIAFWFAVTTAAQIYDQ